MSSTIPYDVARRADATERKKVQPYQAPFMKGLKALGQGAMAGGEAVLRGTAAGKFMPPPVKRKAEADAVVAGVTPTIDQNKQATSAPPGQGGEAPKEPEPRPSRDADYGPDVDPTSFGSMGSVMVHSDGRPDPATQPGGFAHSGSRAPAPGAGTDIPRFAQGAEPEELGGGATIRRGPEGATGGHNWTLSTPSGQEATYDAARYSRAVQGRQASEDAELAKLDAAAGAAKAELVRSEALQEQPFAPEQAEIAQGAAGVEEARAKAAPEMARMDVMADYTREYQENVGLIQQKLAAGQIDAAEADRLMQDQKNQFIMAISGMNKTRVPADDPMSRYMSRGLDDETATQS